MGKTERTPTVNMDQALLDPGSVFATPEELLAYEGMSKEQKIEVLRRWEYDASEVSVAVEEGMPGDDNGLLRRIMLALEQLTGGIDAERTGPTKQHGLSRSAVRPKSSGDR